MARRISSFGALKHPDFRLLWIGQLVSQAGTQMQVVAINWHIYSLTHSAVALGLVGLVRFVPIVIFSLIGGVFADVHNRRSVLLVTQSAMMLFAALLGFLTSAGWVSVNLIYLLAGLTSAAMAFDAPARQSLPPNLVPKEDLVNALSLTNMLRQTATVIGPGLAGFVIAWAGEAAVYWINAASFLGVLIALMFMRTPPQENGGPIRISLPAIVDGIRYVRSSRIILSTMLLDFLGSFFSSASSLLPIFAREILKVGAQGMGILYASESAGAVLAGVAISWLGNIRKKATVLLWALGIYGAATVVYGSSRWFLISAFFLGLVGAADTVGTILRNTIRQLATPDYLRGRMASINIIFSRGGPQLGNLEAGLVASLIGAPLSVMTGGIATVAIVILVAWLNPELRSYGDKLVNAINPSGIPQYKKETFLEEGKGDH